MVGKTVILKLIFTNQDGFGLIEDSVKIGKMANEKLTGEACVMFENSEDAKMAYNDRYK